MGKLSDLHIVLGETIDRLRKEMPSGNTEQLNHHVQANAKVSLALKSQSEYDAGIKYKAWGSAVTVLAGMKNGLIPIDEAYLWAVRDFFQMDRRLPREETKE